MNISIASYAFHGLLRAGRINLFGYLEACRYRYSVRAADIWNGMFESTDDEYLHKIKEELDERELELANLCVDGAHIWDADAETMERNHANALAYLHAAEVLSARTVRIDAGGRDAAYSDEQLDLIVTRYREYAQRAYDNGYRVGPENHWGTEVDPENMKQICEAVDHPGFGVLVHFKGTGEEAFAKWAMHTHIAWDCATGPLVEKMSILRNVNYDGYWSVEHHTGKNEYTETAIQLALVRDVLLKWETEA